MLRGGVGLPTQAWEPAPRWYLDPGSRLPFVFRSLGGSIRTPAQAGRALRQVRTEGREAGS